DSVAVVCSSSSSTGGGRQYCVCCGGGGSLYGIPIDQGVTLDCGHFTCNPCIHRYVLSTILNANNNTTTTTAAAAPGPCCVKTSVVTCPGCSQAMTLDQIKYVILQLHTDNNNNKKRENETASSSPSGGGGDQRQRQQQQQQQAGQPDATAIWRRYLIMCIDGMNPEATTGIDDDVIDLDEDDGGVGRTGVESAARLKEELALATFTIEEEERAAREDNHAGSRPLPSRDCPLCLEKDLPVEDGMRLACDHFMCIPCARDYIKSRIMDGQVRDDEFTCPMPKCTVTIGISQAEYIIVDSAAAAEGDDDGSAIWQKFLEFRFKHVYKTGNTKVLLLPSSSTPIMVLLLLIIRTAILSSAPMLV
ncbi:hypothetical protein FOZ63_009124, partial [Perkinsus olseni]